MADALQRAMQLGAIGKLDGQLGIAYNDLAHMLDDNVAAGIGRSIAQHLCKVHGMLVVGNARDLARNMFGEQAGAMAFELIGSKTIRGRSVFDRLGMCHVIAEPLSPPRGVDRSHRSPVAIDDEALQQAARDELRAFNRIGAQGSEDRLRIVE